MRPLEISQTVTAQAALDLSGLAARLLSPVPIQKMFMDCAESAFIFRQFLIPAAPGEADSWTLAPVRADTAPMAHMISALLEAGLPGLEGDI